MLSGQEQSPDPELKNTDKLIDLLYSVEEFQTRFGQRLESNIVFKNNFQNEYFLKVLTRKVQETALAEYGTSIGRAVLNFRQGEIDSLIAVLNSPVGPAVRKLFALDNMSVENDLSLYVNTVVDMAASAASTHDSLLFEKVYPFDLKEIMNGTFVDSIGEGMLVNIERSANSQRQISDDKVFDFDIQWINNSKYVLRERHGPAQTLGAPVTINIYQIDGDEYRYIWRYPDGGFERLSMRRTEYAGYADEVKAFRWSLYDKYADIDLSPLREQDEIKRFVNGGGHKFYEVSEAYRVTARIERETGEAREITMMTSSGVEKVYRVYGTARFSLGGSKVALELYQPINQGAEALKRLFLPFRDLTSGGESYGGGRYIDLAFPSGDKIDIDFNKSYNPYCAYTDGYSCPIPPKENTLPIAIKAGIKAPKMKE